MAMRSFHSSVVVMARRDNKETARARQVPFNLMDLEPPEDDDTTVAGHIMLRQQRQLLYHMRLIEHEMPKLVGESTKHLPSNGFQKPLSNSNHVFSIQETFHSTHTRNPCRRPLDILWR